MLPRNNAEIIDAKTAAVERLSIEVRELKRALKRISEYSHEMEGTAATWKDIALSQQRIAAHALEGNDPTCT